VSSRAPKGLQLSPPHCLPHAARVTVEARWWCCCCRCRRGEACGAGARARDNEGARTGEIVVDVHRERITQQVRDIKLLMVFDDDLEAAARSLAEGEARGVGPAGVAAAPCSIGRLSTLACAPDAYAFLQPARLLPLVCDLVLQPAGLQEESGSLRLRAPPWPP
jgi:hypothetical protein